MSHFCRELSLLLLLLAHAQADNCLTAIVGQTVQIPCSLNAEASLKTEDISVEWRTSEDLIVHSFVKGQDYWTNQAPQFKGRTQLFSSELSRGNLSLRLSSVSVTDEGSYACYYHHSGELNSKLLCQMCLQIKGLIQAHKESNRVSGGSKVILVLVAVLVVLVGLLIVMIVVLKKRKRKRQREAVPSKDQESEAPLQQTPNKDNPE